MTNPYTTSEYFEMKYEGIHTGHYVVRVILQNKPSYDACIFRNTLSTWLFEETHGEWKMGNMKILNNPNDVDVFILFEKKVDYSLFKKFFNVEEKVPEYV